MNAKQLRDRIDSLISHILFDYNGKPCGIDPLSRTEIDIWYGDEGATLSSVDEVMSAPFFDGKSLSDIVGDLQNIEE